MMKVQALHVAVQVICNGEEVLTVSGTKERYVVDVWSGNHPFFKVCAPRQDLPSCHRFCLMCACGKLAPPQEHSCIDKLRHPSVQWLRTCTLSTHREVVPACDKTRQCILRRYHKTLMCGLVWHTACSCCPLEAEAASQPFKVTAQGSGEQLILDEGRVNKFNKRFASIGSFGQVAPASTGGDKKLEYKVGHEPSLLCQQDFTALRSSGTCTCIVA